METIIPHQFCEECGEKLGKKTLVCPICLSASPLLVIQEIIKDRKLK